MAAVLRTVGVVCIGISMASITGGLKVPSGQPPLLGISINAQTYVCSSDAPWSLRQTWLWKNSAGKGGAIELKSRMSSGGEGGGDGGGILQLQSVTTNPSLATTCPSGNESGVPCYNLVVGPSGAEELVFAFKPADAFPLHQGGDKQLQQLVVVGDGGSTDMRAASSGTPASAAGLCMAASTASGGLLANVYLTHCSLAGSWRWDPTNGTFQSDGVGHKYCLDIGSGGSSGDLGYAFDLLPAAMPNKQAYNSSHYASWGGSVIKADVHSVAATGTNDTATSLYHMFAAVFADHLGLSGWTRHSEIMCVSRVYGCPPPPLRIHAHTHTRG